MVSTNDPVESFLNSIQVVKDALLPLELGIKRAAEDFENCWGVSKSSVKLNQVELNNKGDHNNKVQVCAVKKKSVGNCSSDNGRCLVVGEGRRKGFLIKVHLKTFFGLFSLSLENGVDNKRTGASKKGLKDQELGKEGESCINCLQFAVNWSLLVNGLIQAFNTPFKCSKKRCQKVSDDGKEYLPFFKSGPKLKTLFESKRRELKDESVKGTESGEDVDDKERKKVPLECFLGSVFDELIHSLSNGNPNCQVTDDSSNSDYSRPQLLSSHFDHLKTVMSIWESRKVDVNEFFGNLMFARVGGVPSSLAGVSPSSADEEGDNGANTDNSEETGGSLPQKVASGILNIPLPNVEQLKSTLSTVSLTELIELVPQLARSSKDHPDKKKLFSVQDFFRYTEAEGRKFFEELDRDGDGQVTLEDLEIAVKKRKLPHKYARDFMRRAKSHLFSKSFGWRQFLSLMEQREPTILRAYTSLCLTKSGTLQKSEVLASLKNAGLPANEDNAVAMMRFLKADTEESISYGHFRNFMLFLPTDRLQDDPRSIWFEAATVVAVPPPVEIPAGSVLRSALAGGLSCALSCALMHPVDTIKTRVQASTLTFPEIISRLPQIGVRALYRGSIPAIWGQFTSHGLRTGIFEASKLLLINVAPTLPEIQVQSVASFCSTFLGTAIRIPCEVLKQRLQAGMFNNVGVAILGTWNEDGIKGFFRGTGATLFREVPFYVAGMGLYAESKKVAQQLLTRDLEPWETILVGALSGGLAAVVTTPFDVMKTRMMTARGRSMPMTMVAISIFRNEGPLGLFKGAVPRFFWIAPLGAMNFAGYELAKKALNKTEEQTNDQMSQRKM
ncbi:hypothetical protein K2173_011700 [Erythroxylum novogranatense]|uniref:EF-hand domain-containing protein n=1 Tax=Erythroxylum novogranatense TaxID=1862640 RepID=A0AAV8T153_9ROSI|nr:hypothetical protein K2173_011700 [Erythroxylum novogranatense]